MVIYSVWIVNKAGSLIYHNDQTQGEITESEKTYAEHPVDLVFKPDGDRLAVHYGDREKIGMALVAINDENLTGRNISSSGQNALDFLNEPRNFPVRLRFTRARLSTNDRIMLGSMFHSLYAIATRLSPVVKSSGIEVLEADNFKMHCFQTLTGLKFLVLTDQRQTGCDSLLRKLYEIYSDYALKNPFYSLDMPIRCELFDEHLKKAVDQAEKASAYAANQSIA